MRSLNRLGESFHREVVLLEVFNDRVIEGVFHSLLAGKDPQRSVVRTAHDCVAVVLGQSEDPVVSHGERSREFDLQLGVSLVSIFSAGIGLSDNVVHSPLHLTGIVDLDGTVVVEGVDGCGLLAADVEGHRNAGEFVPRSDIFVQVDFAHCFWERQNWGTVLSDNDSFGVGMNGQKSQK